MDGMSSKTRQALETLYEEIRSDVDKRDRKSVWDWVPQDGFPMKKTVYGNKVCNRCEPGACTHKAEGFAGVPFFSESYLYELLGKEDARTLLGIIRRLTE